MEPLPDIADVAGDAEHVAGIPSVNDRAFKVIDPRFWNTFLSTEEVPAASANAAPVVNNTAVILPSGDPPATASAAAQAVADEILDQALDTAGEEEEDPIKQVKDWALLLPQILNKAPQPVKGEMEEWRIEFDKKLNDAILYLEGLQGILGKVDEVEARLREAQLLSAEFDTVSDELRTEVKKLRTVQATLEEHRRNLLRVETELNKRDEQKRLALYNLNSLKEKTRAVSDSLKTKKKTLIETDQNQRRIEDQIRALAAQREGIIKDEAKLVQKSKGQIPKQKLDEFIKTLVINTRKGRGADWKSKILPEVKKAFPDVPEIEIKRSRHRVLDMLRKGTAFPSKDDISALDKIVEEYRTKKKAEAPPTPSFGPGGSVLRAAAAAAETADAPPTPPGAGPESSVLDAAVKGTLSQEAKKLLVDLKDNQPRTLSDSYFWGYVKSLPEFKKIPKRDLQILRTRTKRKLEKSIDTASVHDERVATSPADHGTQRFRKRQKKSPAGGGAEPSR